jgi:hypothetical protein
LRRFFRVHERPLATYDMEFISAAERELFASLCLKHHPNRP